MIRAKHSKEFLMVNISELAMLHNLGDFYFLLAFFYVFKDDWYLGRKVLAAFILYGG